MYIAPASVILDEMLRRQTEPEATFTAERATTYEDAAAQLRANLRLLEQLRERNRALEGELAALQESAFVAFGNLVRLLRKR